MPSKSRENTYGVFLSSSSYLPGVLALSQSLNNVNSVHPLTVFMTSSSPELLDDINNHGLRYIEVSPLQPPEAIREKNISAGFSRWNGTFAKLRVLEQIQFNKIVMLNADMMVNRNIDFIFDSPHMSAVAAGAKAHPGWEDLNSGFMVLEPSIAVFNQAMEILEDIGTSHLEDFTALGDQDIFQRLMPDWITSTHLQLPESFNAFQDCLPSYERSGYLALKDAYVIHFECKPKPWDFRLGSWMPVIYRSLRWGSLAEIRALRQYRRCLAASDATSF